MRWFVLVSCLVLTHSALHAAGEWRTFTDKQGRKLDGRVVELGSDFVLMEIKSNGKQVMIPFDRFNDAELNSIKHYKEADETPIGTKPKPAADETPPDEEPVKNRLYPHTRDEIRSTIREIMKRPHEKGVEKDLQEATNILNVYRFLCGVPYQVVPDPKFSESATDAAIACKKNGGLSHELGHSTDKCNLSSIGNYVASVAQYIEDSGDNNRERRGHREWCLNPPMGKVGFGSAGDSYSAMWCMDNTGKPAKDIWTYPGRGLFPLEYMHGNAWSLYGVKKPESTEKLKVEVHRLSKRPDKPFSATDIIPGRQIKVNYVSIGMGGINFEPEEPARRGIYWVKVKGPGISESWLVEFY